MFGLKRIPCDKGIFYTKWVVMGNEKRLAYSSNTYKKNLIVKKNPCDTFFFVYIRWVVMGYHGEAVS